MAENGPGQQLASSTDGDIAPKKVFWNGTVLQGLLPPDVGFDELLNTDEALKRLLETLYKFGIAFVCDVPHTEEDTQVWNFVPFFSGN